METEDKVEFKLVRLLLLKEFYEQHKPRVKATMFPNELRTLFETICAAHDTYQRDLTLDEVKALHTLRHPTMTTAMKSNIQELLDEVEQTKPLGMDVAADVLQDLWRIETFREIADLALRGAEGAIKDLSEIAVIVEQRSEDFVPDAENIKPVTDDFDELLDAVEARYKWTMNVPELAKAVPGLAGGDFLIISARPDAGKTAFHVSLTAAPGGWAWQGAKVLVIVNEEAGERTKFRHITAATQLNKDKCKQFRDRARDIWSKVRQNIVMVDSVGLSMSGVIALVRKHKPDIVIIDQLDKVRVDGNPQKDYERLRQIYVQTREVGKRYDCVMVGVCQASADAHGQTTVDYNMLAGSKTDKAGEADVIMAVAPNPYTSNDVTDDPTRFITISKNKIGGVYAKIVSALDKTVSTFR